MNTVTVSEQGSLLIPKDMLEPFVLRPGQQVAVMADHYGVHLVPVMPVQSLFGMFKYGELEYVREKQDREL